MTRLPGIDIFAGMSNLFFGFYSLAACVAAAVSQSKKAVSAAAAVVIGIGLLTAPIDSAHGQVLSHSIVTGVTLTFDAPSDMTSGITDISVDFAVFDTSFYYDILLTPPFTPHFWGFGDFGSSAYQTASVSYSSPQFPSPSGGYYSFGFLRVRALGDSISLIMWIHPDSGEVSAWVTDSDGSFYYVDVTIE